MTGISEYERQLREAEEKDPDLLKARARLSCGSAIINLEKLLNSESCSEKMEGPIAWLINELYRVKDEVIK